MPAAVIAAGVDGLVHKTDPGAPKLFNLYTASAEQRKGLQTLPLNLLDALREFQKDKVLAEGMGPATAAAYFNLRMAQWNDYNRAMSKWEIDNTLDS